MSSMKQHILDKVAINNTTGLSQLLSQTMTTMRMLNNMPLPEPVVELKIHRFLKGLKPILSEVNNKQVGKQAVEIIQASFEAFGIELSPAECFVIFQLRDLGKFRIKDSKLYSDLEKEWGTHPELRIDKSQFKYTLYELKNIKVIDVRRGSVTLSEQIIIEA